ncbi:hypothetical protein [uncultured Helicobacter sp.]|uniref:hypothetical protein n=1 Tax=uncultured Helicobacter sp. TaxID=175537 RepID=UPI00260D8640|nr:hypothetical protein [uncultured Helicobacter sp.]
MCDSIESLLQPTLWIATRLKPLAMTNPYRFKTPFYAIIPPLFKSQRGLMFHIVFNADENYIKYNAVFDDEHYQNCIEANLQTRGN